ncbi:unnamed protein product [Ambrosiozyma monospora]|uniref:Unnamed protein product n=1 Tax=Ambrosiozyma monospora TaxID=43982 RepID=A0ACB5SRK5_AMBMO|nr:unnamed protein product [Ambrosiozyma monospora]
MRSATRTSHTTSKFPSQLKELVIRNPMPDIFFKLDLSNLTHLKTLKLLRYHDVKILGEHLSAVPLDLEKLVLGLDDESVNFDKLSLNRFINLSDLTL